MARCPSRMSQQPAETGPAATIFNLGLFNLSFFCPPLFFLGLFNLDLICRNLLIIIFFISASPPAPPPGIPAKARSQARSPSSTAAHPPARARPLPSAGLAAAMASAWAVGGRARLGRAAMVAPGRRAGLTTLAIETSCDDSSVAVLVQTGPRVALRFHQTVASDNRPFRGIHPLVAVRGHGTSLGPLLAGARAALPPAGPDLVAATRGPGITANLAVGWNTAKGLALAWDVPLVGVHHMQAHALAARLAAAPGFVSAAPSSAKQPASRPEFPFLSLLLSGGHSLLLHSASLTEHRIVAETGDIAVGNLLDQAARLILPAALLEASPDVMYGRQLEAFAFPPAEGNVEAEHGAFFRPASSRGQEMVDVPSAYGWTVALPFRSSRRLAFSFSSIYTTLQQIVAARPAMELEERRLLARHTLRAAFQHLASRLCCALEDEPALRPASATLVVAGGVACNRFLMHVLRSTLAVRGFAHVNLVAPPPDLCTDNAAMIAWAAMEMYAAGWHTHLSALPIGRWSLDPILGPGLLGADGWLQTGNDADAAIQPS